MSVDIEADKLSITLSDHMDKLGKKLEEANDTISRTFNDAHDAVDGATAHVKKVGDACAKLKALLGTYTNGPPS